jgi:hypothetical protein
MQFPMATVKKNALYMLFYKVPLSKNENLFWAIVFFFVDLKKHFRVFSNILTIL